MSSDQTTTENTLRLIKLTDIATWLTQATAGNDGFMLKPNDLRHIYQLILWNYLDRQVTNPDGDVPDIQGDGQITIDEKDLVRLVKIYYHNSYYPYFTTFNNM